MTQQQKILKVVIALLDNVNNQRYFLASDEVLKLSKLIEQAKKLKFKPTTF